MTNETTEERSSGFYFYSCAHGAANTPCPKFCHLDVAKREQPPDMPDNWYENYIPPGFVDCPNCVSKPGGQGRVTEEDACTDCGGAGYIADKKQLGLTDSVAIKEQPR